MRDEEEVQGNVENREDNVIHMQKTEGRKMRTSKERSWRRAIGGNKKHDDVYAWKRPVKPISSPPNLTKNNKKAKHSFS